MPKTRARTRLSSGTGPGPGRNGRKKKPTESDSKDTSFQSSVVPTSTLTDAAQEGTSTTTCTSTGSIGSTLVQEFRLMCTKGIQENPESYGKYAKQIKKYMRNQFDFLGFKAPQRRKLQKELIDKNKEILGQDREALFSFLRELWLQDERDFQCFGFDLCQQFRTEMLGSTSDHFTEAVTEVEACLTSKSWWDTVDSLAYIGECSV